MSKKTKKPEVKKETPKAAEVNKETKTSTASEVKEILKEEVAPKKEPKVEATKEVKKSGINAQDYIDTYLKVANDNQYSERVKLSTFANIFEYLRQAPTHENFEIILKFFKDKKQLLSDSYVLQEVTTLSPTERDFIETAYVVFKQLAKGKSINYNYDAIRTYMNDETVNWLIKKIEK